MCINGILFVLISLKQSGRFLGAELQYNFDIYSRDHKWTNPQKITLQHLDGRSVGGKRRSWSKSRYYWPGQACHASGAIWAELWLKKLLTPLPSPPPPQRQGLLCHTQTWYMCGEAQQLWRMVCMPLHQIHETQKAWVETVLNKDSGKLWLLKQTGLCPKQWATGLLLEKQPIA